MSLPNVLLMDDIDRSAGRLKRSPAVIISLSLREWRNWQTRTVQVRVPVRAWGFKSPLAHQTKRRPEWGAFSLASALPRHSALIPHRLIGLVDGSITAEHQEPVEAACEPAIVRHGDDGSLEAFEALFQGFR